MLNLNTKRVIQSRNVKWLEKNFGQYNKSKAIGLKMLEKDEDLVSKESTKNIPEITSNISPNISKKLVYEMKKLAGDGNPEATAIVKMRPNKRRKMKWPL